MAKRKQARNRKATRRNREAARVASRGGWLQWAERVVVPLVRHAMTCGALLLRDDIGVGALVALTRMFRSKRPKAVTSDDS